MISNIELEMIETCKLIKNKKVKLNKIQKIMILFSTQSGNR